MNIKHGASIARLSNEIASIIPVIDYLYKELYQTRNEGFTLTSGSEGHHLEGLHKPSSLHYPFNCPEKLGRAIDIRTRDLTDSEVSILASLIKSNIGKNFDVIIENNPKHIHVEYQPKG